MRDLESKLPQASLGFTLRVPPEVVTPLAVVLVVVLVVVVVVVVLSPSGILLEMARTLRCVCAVSPHGVVAILQRLFEDATRFLTGFGLDREAFSI